MICHGRESYLERLPTFEPVLPGYKFLRVAQLEAVCKHFGICHVPIARKRRSDMGRNRIVSVAMPSQNELGLLSQVLEIGHGRATLTYRRWALPLRHRADAPYMQLAQNDRGVPTCQSSSQKIHCCVP